jgi:hypothetical protein
MINNLLLTRWRVLLFCWVLLECYWNDRCLSRDDVKEMKRGNLIASAISAASNLS